MGYPDWCALGDWSAHERRDAAFKLSILHEGGEPDEDPVRLPGPVLLEGHDLLARGGAEAGDLDRAGAVHRALNRREVDDPASRLLDFDDERTASAEHPRVHILSPHSVEGVTGPARLGHQGSGDDLLHARLVHLALPAAVLAPFALAAPARPPGLRDPPHELPVSAVHEERVHRDRHGVEGGVDNRDDIGAGDRKSTRLNSSHGYISYAVFCLKKKNKTEQHLQT